MANQIITDVVSGTLTYTGEAIPGTPTSQKSWTIKKTAVSSGVTTISYPQGYNGFPTSNPQFAWDDRASLDFALIPNDQPPILTTITIASDNSNTALAKVGDTVTLTMVSNEYLPSAPVVEIAGHVATVTQGATKKEWTAAYDMVSGDTTGVVDFTIDITDNTGLTASFSSTTNASAVTFDKTAPTLDSAERDSDTQITVTLSELALEASITKANDGGFVVTRTGEVDTYAVSAIAPGATDDLIVLTVADMGTAEAEGVTITYATGGNGTVADLAGNALATDATGVVIATWA